MVAIRGKSDWEVFPPLNFQAKKLNAPNIRPEGNLSTHERKQYMQNSASALALGTVVLFAFWLNTTY